MSETARERPEVIYPDSDGERIAENTLQYDWIMLLHANILGLFIRRDDVFVAADLLWYPVEGDPMARNAPDTMVALSPGGAVGNSEGRKPHSTQLKRHGS